MQAYIWCEEGKAGTKNVLQRTYSSVCTEAIHDFPSC